MTTLFYTPQSFTELVTCVKDMTHCKKEKKFAEDGHFLALHILQNDLDGLPIIPTNKKWEKIKTTSDAIDMMETIRNKSHKGVMLQAFMITLQFYANQK